jgi:signal transduction histidine kinase
MTLGAGPGPDPGRAADPQTAAPAGPPAGRGRRARPVKKEPRAQGRPVRLAVSNWPVAARLVAVFAIASVAGLVFGGLRVSDAVSTSHSYGRTAQLAALGQQATALAQAMEDEQDRYAGVAAYAVLSSDAQAVKAQASVTSALNSARTADESALKTAENNTDAAAARTLSLASAIGSAFPATVQAKAEAVVTMIDSIPGLRDQLKGQPAAQVIANYSNSVGDLFTLNDEITSGSGDAALADEVRALGALSRAKDEASQQRAFLYDILLELSVIDAGNGKHTAADPSGGLYNNVKLSDAFNDAGSLGNLTTAQGLQFADLTNFNEAATQDQSDAYLTTVTGPQTDTAQLIEGFVTLSGDPRLTFEKIGNATTLNFAPGAVPGIWYTDMSAMIGQIRQIETQVTDSIVSRSQMLQHQADNSALVTAVVTVLAVLLVLLLTVLVGRTLVNPLRRLQTDALDIATNRLPAQIAAAAAGDEGDGPAVIEPIGVRSTDEIGRVARAFDQVHAEAVRLAGNEAQLRGSLNAMFISLSRRSVPLIDRLSRMIDGMEQSEDDPDQLANLFSMDHLVTRMRRNSENLLVLAGEEPVRKWTDSVPLSDVTRAAAAEIEQYSRVALTVQPGVMVSGQAAADVVHLLAELIENATLFSPQSTRVQVTVMELSTGGVLIEVRDEGVGVSSARLTDMNWRLDHPPALDVSISRHMGLYAVAHLAARHGIRVKLRPGAPQGLSALVWLPGSLARQERIPAGGTHSRPLSAVGGGPDARRQSALARPGLARSSAGRHRSSLVSSSGDQPALAGRASPPPRPPTVWFAAKRPSEGEARSAAELASGWRPAAVGRQPGAGAGYDPGQSGADPAELGARTSAGQTGAGLPRRMPQTSTRPSSDAPDYGLAASAAGSGPASAGMPVLGAPAGGLLSPPPTPYRPPFQDAPFQDGPYQGSPYQGSPYQDARPQMPRPQMAGQQEQTAARRRSPEAVRNRLSGFQLGSRDAAPAGPAPRQAPQAEEENSR